MKPPQEGRNTGAPSLRGLQGRSATGLNGQAAKEEVSALWRGGWMPENISGVPAGRSVFHLTSPLIGLLARNNHLPRVVIRRAWRIVHSSRSYRFDECKTDWRGQHHPRIRLTRATEIGRTNIGRAGTKRHWKIGQLIENPRSKTSEKPRRTKLRI